MIEAQNLHLEFVRLGGMRYKLKNKMLAILPEIYKSGIYKKYAGSIVEYAGKFGDIAKTTVIKRLRLEKNLENKFYLNAAIEKVGVHKVAMVAKLATAETDKAFAEKVLNMSKEAVQSLSKELRENQKMDCADGEPQACHAVALTTKIELDEESTFLFMKLKAKFGKHLSDKEFLKILLKEKVEQEFSKKLEKKINKVENQKKHEQKISEVENQKEYEFLKEHEGGISKAKSQKEQVLKNVTGDKHGVLLTKSFEANTSNKISNISSQETDSCYKNEKIESQTNKIIIKKVISRYVPAQDRKNSLSKTNNYCSYPNCNLPPKIFHHTDRFAKSKSHDSIVPLCKIHHEFAHNNLIKNEQLSAEKWQLSINPPHASQISQADILYRKYRLN